MSRLPDLEIGATYASPNGMRRVRIAGYATHSPHVWRVVEDGVETKVDASFFYGWRKCDSDPLKQWAIDHGFKFVESAPETERSPLAEEP